MVHIAIAGGSGQVAQEVVDALLAARKHTIVILSRSDRPYENFLPEVQWRLVDYNEHDKLVEILKGTHTLLSFLQPLSDSNGSIQKNLIDAAISAGIQRFAPSEYGSAGTMDMPWWTGKEKTREYLRSINKEKKQLEYTLFQPGLFLDYLAFPHKTAKHVQPLQSVFDFQNCQAIMVDGYEDSVITLTTAADLAIVVMRAVDHEGEWPEIGGISGNKMTISEIIKLGERIRGQSFTVERVSLEDLEAGLLKTSWSLSKRHNAVTDDQYERFVKIVSIGMLVSSVRGAWNVSSEFNKMFPDHKFEQAEEFLARVWCATKKDS